MYTYVFQQYKCYVINVKKKTLFWKIFSYIYNIGLFSKYDNTEKHFASNLKFSDFNEGENHIL